MRARVEIESQVRTLLVAELRRRLNREKLPHLCTHNYRHPLDHRRAVYGETNDTYNRISAGSEGGISLPVVQSIGLCMFGSESAETWPGNICEEPLDAQRCPLFQYRVTRAEVYAAFVSDLANPSWVETSLPAVSALLWVLGSTLAVRTSRFARLWAWASRIFSLSTPKKSADVSVYLPTLDAFPDDNSPRTSAYH